MAEPGLLEAILRGAGQGVTFGFQDELSAFLESQLSGVPYKEALKGQREANEEARQAHTAAFVAGEVTGGAPYMLMGGGGAAKAAQSVVPTLAQVGKGAATAAASGALYGAGTSEAEDIGGVAKDAAVSGAISGGLSGTVGLLGRGLASAGRGAMKNLVRSKLKHVDPSTADEVADMVFTTKGLSPRAVKESAARMGQEAGAEVGDIVSEAGQRGAKVNFGGVMRSIGDADIPDPAVRRTLERKATSLLGRPAAAAGEVAAEGPTLFQQGNKLIEGADAPLDVADDLRKILGEWSQGPTPKARAAKKAYGPLRGLIDKAVEDVSDPATVERLQAANKRVHLTKLLDKALPDEGFKAPGWMGTGALIASAIPGAHSLPTAAIGLTALARANPVESSKIAAGAGKGLANLASKTAVPTGMAVGEAVSTEAAEEPEITDDPLADMEDPLGEMAPDEDPLADFPDL